MYKFSVICIVAVLFGLIPFTVHAQYLYGRVKSRADSAGIPYVNVNYLHNPVGTLTNTAGEFRLPFIEGDTLAFQHLGYVGRKIPILDSNLQVYLADKSFDLTEYLVLNKKVNRSGVLSGKHKKAYQYRSSWGIACDGGYRIIYAINEKNRVINNLYLAVNDIMNGPVDVRVSIAYSLLEFTNNDDSLLLVAESLFTLNDSSKCTNLRIRFEKPIALPEHGFIYITIEVPDPDLEYEKIASGKYALIKNRDHCKGITIPMEKRKYPPRQYHTNRSIMHQWWPVKRVLEITKYTEMNTGAVYLK